MNKFSFYSLLVSFSLLFISACSEHSDTNDIKPSTATYLGNEAIMIEHSGVKVLFDPFFHNTFTIYQAVPENIRTDLFTNQAPYDAIDYIFISHAHADHFSSGDLAKFLRHFPDTTLIAPKQAIDALIDLEDAQDIKSQMRAIELAYKDEPFSETLDNIKFDAVRIPHAGWPERAGIANLVFRVTLNNEITVVHMGDADPNDEHFKPLIAHWDKQSTNTAFPPYWFMTSQSGQLILKERIKAKENIGVHVPIAVPQDLIASKERYFSTPGEKTQLQ